MAKKQILGQLNLFDYIDSIQTPEDYGQMEMGPLMPVEEEQVEALASDHADENQPVEVDETLEIDTVSELNQEVSVDEIEEIQQGHVKEHKEKAQLEKQEDVSKENVSKENVEETLDEEEMISEKSNSQYVMSKFFKDKSGAMAFVAYQDYNLVLVQRPGQSIEKIQCASSKEAVDLYIEKMYEMMDDENLKECI